MTAYLRTPEKLEASLREKVRVVQGDARDKEALKKAMEGKQSLFFATSNIELGDVQAKTRLSRLRYTGLTRPGASLTRRLSCVPWSKL